MHILLKLHGTVLSTLPCRTSKTYRHAAPDPYQNAQMVCLNGPSPLAMLYSKRDYPKKRARRIAKNVKTDMSDNDSMINMCPRTSPLNESFPPQ